MKETTTERESGRRFAFAVSGIFLLALLVRVLHVLDLRDAPFFHLYMGDALSYHEWAERLAGGDWLGHEVFYQSPLYPYFLGVVYKLLGEDVLLVRLIQALLGSFSCLFLALAGRALLSRTTGLLAGALLALYGPALFFDALIQKSVLDSFLLALVLWLLAEMIREQRTRGAGESASLRRAIRRRARAHWVVLGAALGLLALTRENALVFVPCVLAWALAGGGETQGGSGGEAPGGLRRGGALRRRLPAVALLGAGLALVLLPVAVRNQIVGGEFHLTTSQFGPNLYIGNNPEANGSYKPLRFGRGEAIHERRDATELAEKAEGRSLTPGQVSAYWRDRALRYIVSRPGDWLALMARKFALVWNATELEDTEDESTHARYSLPLRVTGFFHFGVLLPLAVAGVVVTWRRRGELWLFHLLPAVYAASVMLFYVFGRYRYPLVPFLVLFAAAALSEGPAWVRARAAQRWRSLLPAGAAVVAVAVFANAPLVDRDAQGVATQVNVGKALQLEGRFDQAIEHYRRAIELRPDYATAHNNLGTALAQSGRYAEAVKSYLEAIRLKPDYAEAHFNLAMAYGVLGRLDDAITQFRESLRLDPDNAEACYNLGIALQLRGHPDEAMAMYRRTLELAPHHAEAHYNLGVALGERGDLDGAIEHFRAALAAQPDLEAARENLRLALEMKKRREGAGKGAGP